jgi:hypothetical protein
MSCGDETRYAGACPVKEDRIIHQASRHNTDGNAHYIINTSSVHNAHLLHQTLPRSLWAPTPLIPPDERLEKHAELALALHADRSGKRAQTKAKAAETRRKKAAKAQEREDESSKSDAEDEDDDDDMSRMLGAILDQSRPATKKRKRATKG